MSLERPKRWPSPQYFRAKQNAERLHGSGAYVRRSWMYSLAVCAASLTTHMNANAITTSRGSARSARGKPSAKSGGKMRVAGKSAKSARAAAKAVRSRRLVQPALESIAHLRQRELDAFGSGRDTARVTDELEFKQISIPTDGTYHVSFHRVELPDSEIFRAGTREKASDFERVIFERSAMSVQPALGATANGVHAIGFVADPTLVVPKRATEGQAVLPTSIEELASVQYFQMQKANKPLSVSVDGLWLHRNCNYNPLRLQSAGENHPADLTSPGWWVYILGGYSNPFDATSPTQTAHRLCHKYTVKFIEPAPTSHKSNVLSHKKVDVVDGGVSLQMKRFIEAAMARAMSKAVSQALGYDIAQIQEDLALLVRNAPFAHAGDRDLEYLGFPPLVDVTNAFANISGNRVNIPYKVEFAKSANYRRDASDGSYKHWLCKIEAGYDLNAFGVYSSGTALTGYQLKFAHTVWTPTRDPSVAQWPGDYVQAWTTLTQGTSGQAPAPIVVTVPSDMVPVYEIGMTVNNNNSLCRYASAWQYGSTNVNGANGGLTTAALTSANCIRPIQAFVAPSTRGSYYSSIPHQLYADLGTISLGVRTGDVIQICPYILTWVAAGDPAPPTLTVDVLPVLGMDVEIFGSNELSNSRLIKVADVVL